MSTRKIIIIMVVVIVVSAITIAVYKIQSMDKKQRKLSNQDNLKNSNMQAFLRLIKHTEGTDKKSNPYAVCYGFSHTITDFSDHPAITGAWRGLRLSDTMCRNAGLGPGCKSTAAGAYQFIKPTWVGLKNKLGLTDFTAESQDLAAIELIREKGAIADIENGDISSALNKVRKVWASLPGAGYGQPEANLSTALAKFNEFKNLA